MAVPQAYELLNEFGRVDPTLLAGAVDTASLNAWSSVGPISEDFKFVLNTLGVAYDAAVYSALREPVSGRKSDLPIGAAIGDAGTGLFFPGFAQDKELEDPDAHAEVNAIRHAKELGVSIGGLTIASTLEPCPSCLQAIDASGLTRVVFGAARSEAEDMGIMKPHTLKAAELVKAGRIASSGRFNFEFFQFPNRAVQAACLEVFAAYSRNTQTEVVNVDNAHQQATRFKGFSRTANEMPSVSVRESEVILRGFRQVLDGFYRNALDITF